MLPVADADLSFFDDQQAVAESVARVGTLPGFVEDAGQRLRDLALAAARGDTDEAHCLARSLERASRVVGATYLADWCEKLEQGSFDEADELVRRARVELDGITHEIGLLLASDPVR